MLRQLLSVPPRPASAAEVAAALYHHVPCANNSRCMYFCAPRARPCNNTQANAAARRCCCGGEAAASGGNRSLPVPLCRPPRGAHGVQEMLDLNVASPRELARQRRESPLPQLGGSLVARRCIAILPPCTLAKQQPRSAGVGEFQTGWQVAEEVEWASACCRPQFLSGHKQYARAASPPDCAGAVRR